VSQNRFRLYPHLETVIVSPTPTTAVEEMMPAVAKRRKHPRPVITPAERQALIELQDGRCAICGRQDVGLFADHSYRTGQTRGLLCCQQNTALGVFRD
jgi:Recombination endonuclease VII